jgi:hypothetical protein
MTPLEQYDAQFPGPDYQPGETMHDSNMRWGVWHWGRCAVLAEAKGDKPMADSYRQRAEKMRDSLQNKQVLILAAHKAIEDAELNNVSIGKTARGRRWQHPAYQQADKHF